MAGPAQLRRGILVALPSSPPKPNDRGSFIARTLKAVQQHAPVMITIGRLPALAGQRQGVQSHGMKNRLTVAQQLSPDPAADIDIAALRRLCEPAGGLLGPSDKPQKRCVIILDRKSVV